MTKFSRDQYLLFLFQFLAHLSIIFMIMYGEWYHWAISLFVYFITGCFGMTITFHRLLSHNSWKAPKWFHIFGTIAGSYGLTGSPIAWCAIHREHHRHSDKEDDPHSPLHKGFVKIQWLSMFETANIKYVASMTRDNFLMFVHKNYFIIHTLILLFWLSIDIKLACAAYLTPAAILWNAGSLINTINHLSGYRNFETKDNSRNQPILGYLVWGEGWHNNHHHDPLNPSFKKKWWEFDLGGFFIKLLEVKK